MEIKKRDVDYDPISGLFVATIAINIGEHNPLMTKAKAELVASIINAVFPIIEAKQAEFEEIYGLEVVKHAHHMFCDSEASCATMPKSLHDREVKTNLMNRIPE